eukprot:scaffold344_cov178-Ochromonas_danica.AAC.19
MYFGLNSPVFKRHPTTLAVYKCLFECIFVQQYLWLPFIKSEYFYQNNIHEEPYYCNASAPAAWWAFATQISFLGSELWFFIISLDMRLAYTNPFSSYKLNRVYFATFVTLASLITAFLLLACGPQVFGVSELGLIWIQSRRVDGGQIKANYPKLVLYYIPSTLIYFYCIWANFQVYKSGLKEVSNTISNRWTIMRRSKRYTAGFVLYGLIVYIIEFAVAMRNHHDNDLTDPTPAYFYALRGVWTLIIILYSNYNELTWAEVNPFRRALHKADLVEHVAQERLLLQPHLNTALRAEILYFTTQGIIFAAKEYSHRGSARVGSTAIRNKQDEEDSKENSPDPTQEPDADEFEDENGNRMYSFSQQGIQSQPHEAGGILRPSIFSRQSTQQTNPPLGATNNSHRQDQTDGGQIDQSNAMGEIDRLRRQQDALIGEVYESAMIEEVESMGINPLRLTLSSSANSSRANAPNAGRPLPDIPNPMHAGENSREHKGEERIRGIELARRNDNSTDNLRVTNDTLSSSDSTVKWAESNVGDVEFGIRGSAAFSERSSINRDSLSYPPPWRRIKAPRNISRSRNSQRRSQLTSIEESQRESSSASSSSVVSILQLLFSSASTAARSVFTPAYRDFRFKDFCPKHFATIRAMHNISAEDYAKSFETTCRERFSEGRSGAFLFYSSDQRCIVKTTTREESITLQALMPLYVAHLEKTPNSLLVRFLGCHCLTMYGVEIYFVVMLNVFPTFQLSERYDLKGSWVNRHGNKGSKKTKREKRKREETSAPLFQDNDLQTSISIDPEVAQALALQVRADVLFLHENSFMDYSLLIGVRRERFRVVPSAQIGLVGTKSFCDARPTEIVRPSTMSGTGEESFVTPVDPNSQCIIDVLQKWTWTKRLERFFKVFIKRVDSEGLSAVPPTQYVKRFWRRVVLDTFEGLNNLPSDIFVDPISYPDRSDPKFRSDSGITSTLNKALEDSVELHKQMQERRAQYARSLRRPTPSNEDRK